jgi:UDP-galactopyranose mutase
LKHYDYVIVGTGFFGTVLAERLYNRGKSVLMIERRNHIGGNCFSYEYEDTNITVHKYGTHIFHCSKKSTWDYINNFCEFNQYQHRVLTTYHNKVFSMPINLGTINAFYGTNLKPSEVESFILSRCPNIPNPKNLEEKAISLIGIDLYEAFIKGYTKKQWGIDPKELPAEIITRLPIRSSYYDSYFDDYYQGLPLKGYTSLFMNMLKGIPLELNTDFFENREYWMKSCDFLIYTGQIDQYFEYSLGSLNWRSVNFEINKVNVEDYQGTSVMNYADEATPYTRIHEPKHLHRERTYNKNNSIIIKEYSCIDHNAPYYPVNSESDKKLFEKYKILMKKEKNVIFGGRMADYKYYDMHHTIEAALEKFTKISK